ncbi:GIY-YIG nuclease family protein [Arthrobacter sedimenti]|uniref:GIY-YIG nuclease family protein n=1 Tax=Arthrobacter sedimenti TaxID=2694931 RepID=A0ABV8WR59_9MICC
MADCDENLLALVLHFLSGPRYPISEAMEFLPDSPGLYAIHASEEVWTFLGLAHRAEVPLYVGKAEDSLVSRDLNSHFAVDPEAAPKTGSSTVRRSFAALLRNPLNLRGVPRNRLKPGYFAHYGLEDEADGRLTEWMQSHLTLACWPRPRDLQCKLANVEKAVLKEWDPPINLQNSPTKLPRLVAERAAMKIEASVWAQDDP